MRECCIVSEEKGEVAMNISQTDISNRVLSEANGIPESGFPLDCFPAKVQSIILDMVSHENYKVEYIATSMLSAVATALGNSYRIHIKGGWNSNSALYIILVGRPGLGKTPPLEAAFKPIRKRDNELLEKFKSEMAAYQAEKEKKGKGENKELEKPTLSRTIVSDFTPEALMLSHYNTPRGIVILVDEIMGMFNSANRYNNGQLIEQLLTAWSGGAIDVVRVGNQMPIHIEDPCINMIGTTQPMRMFELFKKGYEENGFLDRILFVMPISQKIPRWQLSDDAPNGNKSSSFYRWEEILNKILSLEYDVKPETELPVSHLVTMDGEARRIFYEWCNQTIEHSNSIQDERLVESRPMKHFVHVARLALIMQTLRYACGESNLQNVDSVSVNAAIKLNDYFEESYQRIRHFLSVESCEEPQMELFNLLEDSFTTAQAIEIGKQLHVTERTVMNYLKGLEKNRLIHKVKQGNYEKRTLERRNCNK